MSSWWDADAKKYRTTLVYKIFYVWGWSFIRWIMFNFMSSERAHVFAIRFGIPMIGLLDKIWIYGFVTPVAFVFLLVVRLLLFIPGFHCTPPDSKDKQ